MVYYLDFFGNIQQLQHGEREAEKEVYTGNGLETLYVVNREDGTFIRISKEVYEELQEVFRRAVAKKLID